MNIKGKNITFIYYNFQKNQSIKLENKSPKTKHFIILSPVKLKNDHYLQLQSKSDNHTIKIRLLSKRLKEIRSTEINAQALFFDLRPGSFFVDIVVPANTTANLHQLTVKSFPTSNFQIDKTLKINASRLMITPSYPAYSNRYRCAFLHGRFKAYTERKLDASLLVVNDTHDTITTYEYDGVTVQSVSYARLRTILQDHHYQQILIHFFNEKYAQILDATDTSKTNIFIYSHGADTLYWDAPIYGCQYFQPQAELSNEQIALNRTKDQILKRYNTYANVKFVFVCDWGRKHCEELLGEKINNYEIIPCLIDESVFFPKDRIAEHRKKICMIRSFHDLNSYSIDTNVRTILELSRREIFKDLEFSIYGDGLLHDKLLAPIKNFPNVKIYKTFLSADEMSHMFHEHGLALFATRYDSQAVATLECALSGTIPLTSYGTGLSDFINEEIGNFSSPEDYIHMADLIEEYYHQPKKFMSDSKKVYESIMKSASSKYTIDKEIKMLKNSTAPKYYLHPQKPLAKQPLLTVVIPTYNCEKFLYNSVLSLINHDYNDLVEVIIVNDGSKDNSIKIANELKKISPSVKVIDKENGGHGSTINHGIKHATGRYFRLMDGDDYYITDNFVTFLQKLQNEDADIVLTDLVEDFAIDAIKRNSKHYDNLLHYQKLYLDDLIYSGYGFKQWGPLLSTTTCKTQLLKQANFMIDEHCFYVDMEYNFLTYSQSQTVTYYPLEIYNYYLGRSGQSMSIESRKKNYLHHEKVCLRLLEEFRKSQDSLSDHKKTYILKHIIEPMCKGQYYVATELFTSNKPFLSFEKNFKQFPEFYNSREIAGNLIRLHRLTHGLFIRFTPLMIKTLNFIKRK